jgi:hypothetical protein
MNPVGFQTKFPAGERPQTYALGRAATEIVSNILRSIIVTNDYTHTHTHNHIIFFLFFKLIFFRT